MVRLYVATSNPGKLRDFAVATEDLGVAIEPLPAMQEITTPPEDEPTLARNALAKAAYYSRYAPGELVLADDSGLEVNALNGEPGVRSARFAEDAGFIANSPATVSPTTVDERNNLYLLQRLASVPADRRTASYRCVLVASRDGECVYTGEGSVDGTILSAPRGNGGFGYDPLFYLPELGKTMAEIDLATKHAISHRGRALRDLLRSITARP